MGLEKNIWAGNKHRWTFIIKLFFSVNPSMPWAVRAKGTQRNDPLHNSVEHNDTQHSNKMKALNIRIKT
jgi:hypothetical protein